MDCVQVRHLLEHESVSWLETRHWGKLYYGHDPVIFWVNMKQQQQAKNNKNKQTNNNNKSRAKQ